MAVCCTVFEINRDIGRKRQLFIPRCILLTRSLATVCCVIIKNIVHCHIRPNPTQPIENGKILTQPASRPNQWTTLRRSMATEQS